jgi:hypothetical protein
MAKPKQRKQPRSTRSVSQHLRSQSSQPAQLVHPLWLLKAVAAVFALALLCAYASLCLLYWQGQWQLVLHPSRNVTSTPASLGLAYSELHFDDDAAGQPQLDGWWIPADDPTVALTALMLHSGSGSISDALARALTLHNAHLNVLLFDYRGFGRSTGRHPSEDSMQTDAASVLNWLISTQHIPPQQIILYGQGIGASLAVQLAATHHEIPAIILDAPDGDLFDRVAHDPRSRLVPAHWLFTETFPLAAPLHTLSTPKLLISYNTPAPPAALAHAADPKMTIELASPNDPVLQPSITRFLDLNLTHAH